MRRVACGRWIATASEDHTARIWDARTGFPVTEPLVHASPVRTLIWMLDSQRVLTGNRDTHVRLWKVPALDSVPRWLPDLAEALAGKRNDNQSGSVAVAADSLHALRQRAKANTEDTPENRWLRWFLIERLRNAGQ